MGDRKRIPVFSPVIGREEKAFVNDCLDTHWVSQGTYVRRFEEAFSRYCGCRYGVATSNGTAALHLASIASGLGPGDEVLVSSSTNMASAFAVCYCGARPVPVDIEPDTWQMNPALLPSLITPRTKAVMAVHLFGHPVDMDPVMRIAREHGLRVIEDCAEAHGAEYKGRKVGSIGDIGCFSFFSNKIITSGEGGMVVTNSAEMADKVRSYGNLCYGRTRKFFHDGIGYNYRLSNVNAAIGLGQLHRIESILERKREIHEAYRRNLEGLAGLHIPVIKPWAKSVMWMFNARLTPAFRVSRDDLMQGLLERGIESREAFVPVNRQEVLLPAGRVKATDCPVADAIMETGFYLPSGLSLTEEDLAYVCDAVREIGGSAA